MKMPIFPNSSYLLTVGATEDHEMKLRKAAAQLRTRPFFCRSYSEFIQAAESLRHIVGIFLFVDGSTSVEIESILNWADLQQIGVHLFLGNSPVPRGRNFPNTVLSKDFSALKAKEVTENFLQKLIPQGLDKVHLNSVQFVFGNFFPTIGDFHITEISPTRYQRQVDFSLVCDSLVGYSTSRANIEELAKLLPENQRPITHMVLQEALNQALGIVMQDFLKIGVNFKGGLPTHFDLTRIPAIQTMIYFPSVHVTDSRERVFMSLGFVDLEKKPLFDLSNITPGNNSGEVEFL